jgi:protein disulfide-isomerase A1
MRLSLLSGLFLATVSGVFAAEDSDVIDLTAANFDTIVKPADLILVEFFCAMVWTLQVARSSL